MQPVEWSLAAVHDVIAGAAPDRSMLVWKDTRRTYSEVAARTRRLAVFLRQRGIGIRRERRDLERWECGQSTVALLLYNCPEYLEAMLGCFRARAVPFNVNQHYRPAEIGSLLDMVGAEVAVVHRALGPLVAEVAKARGLLLLDVDDGSGVAPLAGSTPYEHALRQETDAAALPKPSPDDLYLVCTGGTTGSPKGVLWRQADIFVSSMGGIEGVSREQLAAKAAAGGGSWFAAPPLMHAAAQWTAFAAIHSAATVVLHDDTAPFDARTILETVVRERVDFMSIVGDAFARRLIDELQARPYDLASLRTLATGGAVTSDACKEALLERLPHITIVDGYGASETGGMAYGASRRGARAQAFAPRDGARVLSADRQRFLAPGDEEIGWTARRGRVPLGYLGDRKKTEETFPILDGERVAVPGDRARLAPDGGIVLLGRDALVVNSGGEKIFVEEVEEVLRGHPDVVDALVVGRPSERFGEEVVGIVQLRPGVALEPHALREFAAGSLARFKAPRAIAFCERVHRHASGKPDYRWARSVAEQAATATARPLR
ncbi:MAG TPA: AMP-binding protein [Myxococcota bacterium]|nr:AMP-binding protein [Myxococcota bacterium]